MSPAEGDLEERALRGDELAFHALYEREAPILRAFVAGHRSRLIAAHEEVDDLLESIRGELWEHRIRFTAPGFRSWLFAIARTKIAERARHYRALRRSVGREAGAVDSDSARGSPALSSSTPSRRAMRAEDREALLGALARLPANYQAVIRMAYFEDLSRAEMAARMGTTDDAVRALLSRALRALSGNTRPALPRDGGGR